MCWSKVVLKFHWSVKFLFITLSCMWLEDHVCSSESLQFCLLFNQGLVSSSQVSFLITLKRAWPSRPTGMRVIIFKLGFLGIASSSEYHIAQLCPLSQKGFPFCCWICVGLRLFFEVCPDPTLIVPTGLSLVHVPQG